MIVKPFILTVFYKHVQYIALIVFVKIYWTGVQLRIYTTHIFYYIFCENF